jgi:hypothetical protein
MTAARAEILRDQAAHCLRLAREILDEPAHQALIEMSEEYERQAVAADAAVSD